MDDFMSLRRRFFRLRRKATHSILHGLHAARTAMELGAGLKPLAPPQPQVKKAGKIRKALLVCASEQSGYSHPHALFSTVLGEMSEASHFDYPLLLRRHGRKEMNRMLLRQVERDSPDLMYLVLFTDEIGRGTLRAISEGTPTITFNCFCDDEWRFETYSRYWAPLLNSCATTCPKACRKYLALGYPNAMFTHWFAEPRMYLKSPGPMLHDVSFVGTAYPERRPILERLQKAGIRVSRFGAGWQDGPLPFAKMVETFGRSRININFSRSMLGNVLQEKGRMFEVCASGGFLLTEGFPGIEECLEDGKEAVFFTNEDELAEKIRYYLKNEGERMAVAEAGYRRTIREHTSRRHMERVFDFVARR